MWILAAMYVLLIPSVALFVHNKHKLGDDTPLTVAVKAACTTIIVLAAIAGAVSIQEHLQLYAVLVAAGLTFGLVGDVVICQKAPGGFLSGMLYFGLGHLCYIAAFAQVSRHVIWSMPVFLVLYLPFLFIIRKLAKQHRDFQSMVVPVAVYGAIIIAMVSLAVTVPFTAKKGFILLSGAILFAISDGILAYGIVYKEKKSARMDAFGLYCYFIGQSLFTVSLYCLC